MAKIVKKTRKLGSRGSASGTGKITSPLRPFYAPKLPSCREGCPNGTNIREMLTTISLAEKHNISYEEAFKKAWDIVTEKNPLPAVCGRVCPHPCEDACNRNDVDEQERQRGDPSLTAVDAVDRHEEAAQHHPRRGRRTPRPCDDRSHDDRTSADRPGDAEFHS